MERFKSSRHRFRVNLSFSKSYWKVLSPISANFVKWRDSAENGGFPLTPTPRALESTPTRLREKPGVRVDSTDSDSWSRTSLLAACTQEQLLKMMKLIANNVHHSMAHGSYRPCKSQALVNLTKL